MTIMRVNSDDLDFSDSECCIAYEGRPFSGVAFELDLNGCLINEMSYLYGLKDGLTLSWYPSGAKKSECHFLKDVAHGRLTEWFESGKVKTEALFEYGYCLKQDVWNENGELIESE